MATKKTPKLSLEAELEELQTLRGGSVTADAIARIRAALGSPRSFVVERAATIAKEWSLVDVGRELVAAFERFLIDPVKRDPGCKAKLAALEALDFTDFGDPGPFLVGARHVQMEPAWGPPIDSAVALRARALMALARLAHPALPLMAGDLLADKESPVRQAAADALGMLGDRGAAGALALKLAVGDDDGLVLTACASALLVLAPDWALPRFAAIVGGKDELLRETVALALGQSRLEGAHDLLVELLEAAPRAEERAIAYRALGLQRSERSLAVLLERVATGAVSDAKMCVEALAPRRFEPGMPARVRVAVEENGAQVVRAVFEELFSDV